MPVRWQLLRGSVLPPRVMSRHQAGVQLGRLLRTAFLADYFVKDAFRNELRRVLNRGEAVNALKRAIIPAGSARRRPNVSMKCRLWPMR